MSLHAALSRMPNRMSYLNWMAGRQTGKQEGRQQAG